MSDLVSHLLGFVSQRQIVLQSKNVAEMVGENLHKALGHLKAAPVDQVSHSTVEISGRSHTTDRSQHAPSQS